jgi:hypothetical protein
LISSSTPGEARGGAETVISGATETIFTGSDTAGDRVQQLARLLHKLLGGVAGSQRVPLASLGEKGNDLLQQGIQKGMKVFSCAASLIDALRAVAAEVPPSQTPTLPRPFVRPLEKKNTILAGGRRTIIAVGIIAGAITSLMRQSILKGTKLISRVKELLDGLPTVARELLPTRSPLGREPPAMLLEKKSTIFAGKRWTMIAVVVADAITSLQQRGILKGITFLSRGEKLDDGLRAVAAEVPPPGGPPRQGPPVKTLDEKSTPFVFAGRIIAVGFIAAAIITLLTCEGSKFAKARSIPKAATKEAPFVNSLGMIFVPVPITGGPTTGKRVLFSIWDTRVQDYGEYAREKGITVQRPPFEQGSTHPVVEVSWEDAKSFCAWLTARERNSGEIGAQDAYRLPSDHEWSSAVGIGRWEKAEERPASKDGNIKKIYPWGTAWPPPKGVGNYGSSMHVDDFEHTSPVGSFLVNEYGLYDMGGNVGQWCEDWYDAKREYRVVRGASWLDRSEFNLQSSFRNFDPPTNQLDVYGFRCVLVVPGG